MIFVNVLLDWMLVLLAIIGIGIILAMLSCLRVLKEWLESYSRKIVNWLRPLVSKHADFSDRIDRIIDRLYLVWLGIAALVTIVFMTAQAYKWASDEGKKIARKTYDEILSGKPSTEPFPSRATLLITNPAKGFDTYSAT